MSSAWDLAPKRLRNAHDPPVALILWIVLFLSIIGSALTVGLEWGSIPDALTVFGGVVVLLGSYFAARTLRENEADRATQMLASTSDAVRVAGVHRLRTLARETPLYLDYVRATLQACAHESPGEPAGVLASAALKELPKPEGTDS